MTRQLSPKDLAMVIGVSESSLKRWVDEGRLVAARTAGGHRRIALHEAIRFIRDTNQTLTHPELLGLTDLTLGSLNDVTTGAGDASLHKALESGDAELARGLILAQFLASRSIASVCDGPISHAMNRIGELWRHDQSGIAIEHRATEIVIDALHQIRATMPPVPDDAPRAVGSTGPADLHATPTLMAATVLMESGYRDTNFGANMPIDALVSAARDMNATLIWFSVSMPGDTSTLLAHIKTLAEGAASIGATLAVGGRGISGAHFQPMPGTHVVGSMAELAAVARAVKSAGSPRVSQPIVSTLPSAMGAKTHHAALHVNGRKNDLTIG